MTQVFFAIMTLPPSVADLISLASPWERKQSRSFGSSKRIEEFIGARVLVRATLGHLDPSIKLPQEIGFDRRGKPLPIGPYRLSWSHTQAQIGVAISKGIEIGVDIESVHKRPDLNALIARYGSKSENLQFQQLLPSEKETFFYQLWTLKEAFGKMMGSGLQYETTHLHFQYKNQRLEFESAIQQQVATNTAFFHQFQGQSSMALCLGTSESPHIQSLKAHYREGKIILTETSFPWLRLETSDSLSY